MSIGGPSGIGGPRGPRGPTSPDDATGPDGTDGIDGTDRADRADRATGSGTTDRADLDHLAAEVAAGRLTPREAIDQLVEATATPELSAAERAELRQLMTDLVENDPYFTALTSRI